MHTVKKPQMLKLVWTTCLLKWNASIRCPPNNCWPQERFTAPTRCLGWHLSNRGCRALMKEVPQSQPMSIASLVLFEFMDGLYAQ